MLSLIYIKRPNRYSISHFTFEAFLLFRYGAQGKPCLLNRAGGLKLVTVNIYMKFGQDFNTNSHIS
jgi:hypothetical protein